MTHDELNTLLDEAAIVRAIREAEERTSGEIRVLVLLRAVEDPLAEARRRFADMGMEGTACRNGVLLLIAPESRNFAILGDEGIHRCGGEALWSGVAAALTDDFRAERWTAGVVGAVARVGEALARHFPSRGEADTNELPDIVVRDRESPVDSGNDGSAGKGIP